MQHLQSNPKGAWLSQFIRTICSFFERAVTQAHFISMHFNVLMNTHFESKPASIAGLDLWASKGKCKESSKNTRHHRRVQNANLRNSVRETVDEWAVLFFKWQLSFSSKPAGCGAQKKADKCEMTPDIHMNKHTVKQCSSYTQTNSSSTHTRSHQPPRCQTMLSSPSKDGVSQTISASIVHGHTHYALERPSVQVLHAEPEILT